MNAFSRSSLYLFLTLPAIVFADPAIPETTLTLSQAVQLALKQNPSVSVQRDESTKAILELRKARSHFWPRWKSTVDQVFSRSPSVFATDTLNQNFLISERDLEVTTGIFGRLPTDTEPFVRFSTQRNTTDSANALVSPYYFSRLEFGASQPLLRGLNWFDGGMGNSWTDLKIAAIRRDLSRDQLILHLSTLVGDTELAYWEFVARKKVCEARIEAVELTRKQVEFTQRKIDAGLAVPAEIYSFQERFSTRQVDLLQAEKDLKKAETRLENMLGLDLRQEQVLIPADGLEFKPFPIPKNEILESLDASNPKIISARRNVDAKRLELSQKKNLALPTLDLSGSYFLNGGNTPTATGYGSDLDQLMKTSSHGWQITAVLDVPLGPSSDLVDFQTAKLEYRQALSQLEVEKATALSGVLQAYEDVKTSESVYQTAKEAVDLSQRKVEFETKKYQAGLSTGFGVLQFQEDLTNARIGMTESLLIYEKAMIELNVLGGRILSKFGIELVEEQRQWTTKPLSIPPHESAE